MITQLKSKLQLPFLTLLILGLFIACEEGRPPVYDQYLETTGVWEKADVKSYVYKAEDTLQAYNLFMNLRVNKDYPYSNMYVVFKVHQPNQEILVDTLQFEMADSEGRILGKGFSDIKENKLWLREDFRFNQSGSYKFSLEHVVRELGEVDGVEVLPGISEVGLSIEVSE